MLKHKLDMEKATLKNDQNTIDAENVMAYNIEEITRLMHQNEIN
jgi:hypothetical protein